MALSDFFPLRSLSWWLSLPSRWMKRFASSPGHALRLAILRCRVLMHALIDGKSSDAPALGRVRPREVDYSVAVPFGYPVRPTLTPSIAVLCHIYYDELADEIAGYLANLPFPADLFISTTTEAKRNKIQRCFAERHPGAGTVEIRVAPNRGRDIAPKLIAFSDVYRHYEFVLHIHTKQSFHAKLGDEWRHFLFGHLLGSPEIVLSIFDAFARIPELGMVLPQYWEPIRRGLTWGDNFDIASSLAGRMGFRLLRTPMADFPAGSMFWARSAALGPLLDLGLSFDDFEAEAGQTDGTLAHAIERLYVLICEHAGMKWLKICVRSMTDFHDTVVDVQNPTALAAFVRDRAVSLAAEIPVAMAPSPPPPNG